MDTRALDMLHDTRNQDILSIADRVYLNLLTLQILVHQNRMLLGDPVDDADELFHILIVDGNLHALAAQYVGRANQNRIAQLVCCLLCLLGGKYRMSLGSRNLTLLQNLVKELSVLCRVHIFRGSTKDGHAHLHQRLSQLDGRLSAELYHSSVRLLQTHDALHVLRSQGLEIQLICNIKVGTYRLRVIVDDNGLIAFFRKSPGTVYRTEVELDTLSDADGAAAQNQYLLAVFCFYDFIFTAKYRVVIGCACLELCRAGIYHLVYSGDAVGVTELFNLLLRLAGQAGNDIVRELDPFRFF